VISGALDYPDDATLAKLNPSQRGLLGARILAAAEEREKKAPLPGEKPRACYNRLMTQKVARISEVLDRLQIAKQTLNSARIALKRATIKELSLIEAGTLRVWSISRQIRRERAANRDIPMNQIGKNPEKIQRQKLRTEVWRRLRDGLEGLTNLPNPRDVVTIVRSTGSGINLVDRKLLKAQEWLGEFCDEWTKPPNDQAD
jgi:hypothetical protein